MIQLLFYDCRQNTGQKNLYNNENNFDENHFYNKINQALKNLTISARIKPEFWANQWEYESDF